MCKKFIKNPTKNNEQIYKKDRNKLNHLIQIAKKSDNNVEINDPNLNANNFNDFFVNAGPKLAKEFSHDTDEFYKYLKGNYSNSFFLFETSPDKVNRIKDKLECKSSCGTDEIKSKVIKYVAPYVSVPVSHNFNLTFATGKIPNALKVALITPVHKASEKNLFSNYRPISVLPFFSKHSKS